MPTAPPMHSWRILAAAAIGSAGIFIVFSSSVFEISPFPRQMIAHIALMNLFAPIWAFLAYRIHFDSWLQLRGGSLILFSILQITVFYAWHSPPLIAAAMHNAAIMIVMQATLFTSAFLFWLCIFGQSTLHHWRSVAALLITGKLFCLMAALLIFAPRALYAGAEAGGASHVKVSDQQLAGLIMAVICPLAYVGSAVVVTTRWLLALPQTEDAP